MDSVETNIFTFNKAFFFLGMASILFHLGSPGIWYTVAPSPGGEVVTMTSSERSGPPSEPILSAPPGPPSPLQGGGGGFSTSVKIF